MTILQSQGFKTLGEMLQIQSCKSFRGMLVPIIIKLLQGNPGSVVFPCDLRKALQCKFWLRDGQTCHKIPSCRQICWKIRAGQRRLPRLGWRLAALGTTVKQATKAEALGIAPGTPPKIEHLWTSSFIIYDFPCLVDFLQNQPNRQNIDKKHPASAPMPCCCKLWSKRSCFTPWYSTGLAPFFGRRLATSRCSSRPWRSGATCRVHRSPLSWSTCNAMSPASP